MKTISGKLTKLKDCKVGDIISLSSTVELESNVHLNIIVKPGLTLENKNKGEEFAFNVISLSDGRPRTFHPEEGVYVYDREEVFNHANVQPENIPEVLKNIDWELLRKQKGTLLNIIEDIDNVEKLEHVEGIIVLLDALQDSAVDDYGLPENLVFNLSNNDKNV